MKDDDDLPVTSAAKRDSAEASLFGRGRYKFWALAAILLLAFWSMFTGTITLRWSAGNLNRISDDSDTRISDDLDVLEMDERETVVQKMWDVYTRGHVRLPRFWQESFEAGYEELTSDDPGVRDAAISEIAKMSISLVDIQPPPVQTVSARELHKSIREMEKVS
uniref:Uncharacterized protein n=1 Tax=Kalanchoe fedtschenkoi TaxID=63787 RepID=A0A7N0UC20_KALFE